jgi:hypothetical protein
MARHYSRFECGFSGCSEIANYESATRSEQTKLYQMYGQGRWRCTRHSQPDTVLGASNPRRSYDVACSEHFYESRSTGKYWGAGSGASGFVYGPGFRAFAKDFPIGTVLRVTAEIIFPATPDAEVRATKPDSALATDTLETDEIHTESKP